MNCYHDDNHYPKGDYNTRVPQVPILNYGLRWVNIWYGDNNLPLKGIVFALPVRTDNIDAVHMDVAMRGPSSCSAQIEEYAHTGDLPYLGLPTLHRVRIPRTPARRPAPRTPGSDQEP
eukprot:8284360-Pyramimonas_sp.AAC.1